MAAWSPRSDSPLSGTILITMNGLKGSQRGPPNRELLKHPIFGAWIFSQSFHLCVPQPDTNASKSDRLRFYLALTGVKLSNTIWKFCRTQVREYGVRSHIIESSLPTRGPYPETCWRQVHLLISFTAAAKEMDCELSCHGYPV